jgi:hypothetical protein
MPKIVYLAMWSDAKLVMICGIYMATKRLRGMIVSLSLNFGRV